ncbi:DUF2808 domain-containing protein [Tumidithrix helvetica PCC 7403]|uniref:hypothetical protein n=1 Tax=Tumidithrix helvetica TaxID=3457545 RepID=UPI003C97FAA5
MLLNRFGLGLLCVSTLWVFTPSAKAETCHALNVVGGTGTQVTKTVSPLGTLITNDNWNTDFSIPGGKVYNRYVVTIVSKNEATYDLRLKLKYSNNTADEFYNKNSVAFNVGQSLQLVGVPRSQVEPYQINMFVGGLPAIGNTYTLSVDACN